MHHGPMHWAMGARLFRGGHPTEGGEADAAPDGHGNDVGTRQGRVEIEGAHGGG